MKLVALPVDQHGHLMHSEDRQIYTHPNRNTQLEPWKLFASVHH